MGERSKNQSALFEVIQKSSGLFFFFFNFYISFFFVDIFRVIICHITNIEYFMRRRPTARRLRMIQCGLSCSDISGFSNPFQPLCYPLDNNSGAIALLNSTGSALSHAFE